MAAQPQLHSYVPFWCARLQGAQEGGGIPDRGVKGLCKGGGISDKWSLINDAVPSFAITRAATLNLAERDGGLAAVK